MSENWYQAIDAYQELNAVIQVLSDGVSHISGRAGSSTAMVMG